MNGTDHNLLLTVDHVKYRKAGDGKSPIGRLSIYKEYVEWRDNTGPEILHLKFSSITVQRVSPPHKSRVQLQMVLQNDDQATFVFLNPALDKAALQAERDSVKEVLQNALIAHRARVNQMAASLEKGVKMVELEEKQALLRQNAKVNQLFNHLVQTKLLSPQDFWSFHFKTEGVVEDSAGISGAFLANIAQQDGTNGIKLNLNSEIIQSIFVTYPAVEKKHLEVVPHEMSEQQFWSKFFQSHYFHREREVLPNPKDPFADCVKGDDLAMTDIQQEGVQRKRFDLNHLDDYVFRDFIVKNESNPKAKQQVLIKRCNYLSEKIVETSLTLALKGDRLAKKKVEINPLFKKVQMEEERRLESDELNDTIDVFPAAAAINMSEARLCADKNVYTAEEARMFKSTVLQFFDSRTNEDILNADMENEEVVDVNMDEFTYNKDRQIGEQTSSWGISKWQLQEVRDIHLCVNELCRHFWSCFPPLTSELEEKIIRMEETLMKYQKENLSKAAETFGYENIEQCYLMLQRAHEKYAQFVARKRK